MLDNGNSHLKPPVQYRATVSSARPVFHEAKVKDKSGNCSSVDLVVSAAEFASELGGNIPIRMQRPALALSVQRAALLCRCPRAYKSA